MEKRDNENFEKTNESTYVITNGTVYCSNCGTKINQEDNFCKVCGKKLIGKLENTNIFDKSNAECSVKKQKYSLNIIKNKKIVVAFVMILIIVVAFIIQNSGNSGLSGDEKIAYEACVNIQKMLKDPNSFKLYDDFLFIDHYDDMGSKECTYLIFKYGGTNGYGAVVTQEAIFKDGKYIMDYGDELDEDDFDYEQKRSVAVDIATYGLAGDSGNFKSRWVENKKVIKKLGIE